MFLAWRSGDGSGGGVEVEVEECCGLVLVWFGSSELVEWSRVEWS